jgi:3-hydroxyacyl-[acyl-carrier-protein] dehydratase
MGLENAGSVFLLTIDNAKFRRPVVPGDQMLLRVKKMKQRGNISKFACIAEVDGVKVAEADVSAMTGA